VRGRGRGRAERVRREMEAFARGVGRLSGNRAAEFVREDREER